jgi:hypothetical protein
MNDPTLDPISVASFSLPGPSDLLFVLVQPLLPFPAQFSVWKRTERNDTAQRNRRNIVVNEHVAPEVGIQRILSDFANALDTFNA